MSLPTGRRLVATLAFLWLVLGLLGFTGSSWFAHARRCDFVPDLRAHGAEVLGFSRHLRSDEWASELPTQRAQQLADPPFPLVHPGQGLGQIQRSVCNAPVLDWGIVFRPLIWPLLLRSQWALGFRWYWRNAWVLLCFFVGILALVQRDRVSLQANADRERIAALAALALSMSSAVNWWLSSTFPDVFALGLATYAAAARAARAPPRAPLAAWTALVAWLSACTFTVFYPPFWGPTLLLVGAGIVDVNLRVHGSVRVALSRAALSLAAVLFGVAVGFAYYAPYFLILKDTLYPGGRVAVPGSVPWSLLHDMVWPSRSITAPPDGIEDYLGPEAGYNVCEASVVEVPPLFALLLALVHPGVRAAAGRVLRAHPMLVAVTLFLGAWLVLPLPPQLGLFGLRWTPPHRAMFCFGIAATLSTAAWLSELTETRALQAPRRTLLPALAGLTTSLVVTFEQTISIARESVRIQHDGAIAATAGLTALGLFHLHRRAGALLLATAWALPLMVTNLTIHPVSRSESLFAPSEAHDLLDQVMARVPGRLLDYSHFHGMEHVAYGRATLATEEFAPDLGLARFLAPETGLTEFQFNRFAMVTYILPPRKSYSEPPDRFGTSVGYLASLSPCSPRLRTLWVNHIVLRRNDAFPATCAEEFDVARAGRVQVFTRREPVCPVGVAPAGPWPTSALAFDYRCGAAPGARLVHTGDGAVVHLPATPGAYYAVALNRGLIGTVSCTGAEARSLDAHLTVRVVGTSPGRCIVRYRSTWEALLRLARIDRSPTW
jgi:hypothetical protein